MSVHLSCSSSNLMIFMLTLFSVVNLIGANSKLIPGKSRETIKLSSSVSPSSTSSSSLSADERVLLSQSHMQFTFDLMSSIVMTEAYNPNSKLLQSIVFSPLSIQSILMMVHLGVKGRTRAEIASALHLDNFLTSNGINTVNGSFIRTHQIFGESVNSLLDDDEIIKYFSMANQIFINKDLNVNTNYKKALQHYHDATLQSIDFNSNGVVDKINDWVTKTTKGAIKKFLSSPISPSTALVALNALSFRGDWLYKFDEQETQKNSLFQLTNGQNVRVSMMVGKLPIAFGEINDGRLKASIIELPYKTQRLGLFMVLPLEDSPNALFNLMRSLNSTSFTQLIASMKKSKKGDEVNVRIPKFDISSKPDLTTILRYSLGLRSVFSGGEADFTSMFDNSSSSSSSPSSTSSLPPISLSQFTHQAVMSIDENGSIAGAASATLVERVGLFNGPYFEADRPFIFFLTDKQSGLILFAGIFASPN
ncbi:leukocyte elastase inhibitor-like [Panonychus citri]|uniref:leukocyte elastase inhibitor-like n=1 Tax=Panonychus citri TaxID=50023 RepID=UPI002307595B|nr:leukocyte elastase inhibitor-like [Panonychus citri]